MKNKKRLLFSVSIISLLYCAGCSGGRAYFDKSFSTSILGVHSISVLTPEISIKQQGLLINGGHLSQLEAALELQASSEIMSMLQKRSYNTRSLSINQDGSAGVDLAIDLKALTDQFNNVILDLKPMDFREGKKHYLGIEISRLGTAMNSDAFVLVQCHGIHWQRSPGMKGTIREIVRDVAVSTNPLLWHNSQLTVKIVVVRASDGLIIWYGDNMFRSGLDIMNEKQFRAVFQQMLKQFPINTG